MKKQAIVFSVIFVIFLNSVLLPKVADIKSLSRSIEELKNQIQDISIEATVLNSGNNFTLIGNTGIWYTNEESSLKPKELLISHYISIMSLSGKIISPWRKFFEYIASPGIEMPLGIRTDRNGNTYVFWGYGQWDGPRGCYLRFTMFDREGNITIDTFKVDNEEKFDTLNIGSFQQIKEDEKGNLHLFANQQYVLINTQKGMPEATEKLHFIISRRIPLPKPQWKTFPLMGRNYDFYPLPDKRFFVTGYSGEYELLVEMSKDFKSKFDLSSMEPIDAYKKENFTSAIINFDNWKYENPNIINIQGYATRKYVGLNLPEHFRLQGAGNLKNGLLCLIKLEDKFLLNLTKKNEVGEIELFQIFFDKEGNPIKPEHTGKVLEPKKFEDL